MSYLKVFSKFCLSQILHSRFSHALHSMEKLCFTFDFSKQIHNLFYFRMNHINEHPRCTVKINPPYAYTAPSLYLKEIKLGSIAYSSLISSAPAKLKGSLLNKCFLLLQCAKPLYINIHLERGRYIFRLDMQS